MNWTGHPAIKRAAAEIKRGGVVAYPTEAVWGLGCLPTDESAVGKLLLLKRRDVEKGLIVIAGSIEQVDEFLSPLSQRQKKTLLDSWPGPYTWLIPDDNRIASELVRGQYSSVAIRVSAHPTVVALCAAVGGPIISTSANPQGCQPARQLWQVKRYFGDQLDAIVPGQVNPAAKPSEIRDLVTGNLVRAG